MISLGMHAEHRTTSGGSSSSPVGSRSGLEPGVLSPLLAFGIAELFSLDPALAVGLVLLGASPGGTMANLLTHLARGDTALSISMTGISSVASVDHRAPLPDARDRPLRRPTASTRTSSMLGIVAPGAADHRGAARDRDVAARATGPSASDDASETFQRIAFGVFLAIVVGVIAAEHDRVIREPHRGRGRDDHAQPGGDGDLVHGLAAGPPRRPPGDGGRDGARGSTTPPSRSRSARRSRPC